MQQVIATAIQINNNEENVANTNYNDLYGFLQDMDNNTIAQGGIAQGGVRDTLTKEEEAGQEKFE